MPTTTLPYRYTHASTESMTGYFSCEPPEDLCFEDALARLEAAPLDEFLHRHLLRRIAALPPDEAAALRTPSRPAHGLALRNGIPERRTRRNAERRLSRGT